MAKATKKLWLANIIYNGFVGEGSALRNEITKLVYAPTKEDAILAIGKHFKQAETDTVKYSIQHIEISEPIE